MSSETVNPIPASIDDAEDVEPAQVVVEAAPG